MNEAEITQLVHGAQARVREMARNSRIVEDAPTELLALIMLSEAVRRALGMSFEAVAMCQVGISAWPDDMLGVECKAVHLGKASDTKH